MRISYLEVDVDAILANIKAIRKLLRKGTKIMPIIKNESYGIGTEKMKDLLEKAKIDIVGVALPEEAIVLRRQGITIPILVLNSIIEEEVEKIVDYDLVAGLSNETVANKLNEYAKQKDKTVKIHVEVDTGMGRTGLQPFNTIPFIEKVQKLSHIQIEGIYTHFSSADGNEEYTNKQISEFNKILKDASQRGIHFQYVHSSASAGIIGFEDAQYNLVRPGIIVYGYYPKGSFKEKIQLKPCTKLKSKIVFLKEVEKEMAISYGRRYVAKKGDKIATIPLRICRWY